MSVMRRAVLHAASQLEHLPEQGAWRQSFCFAADSAVFAGHFPGHPVLPAVVCSWLRLRLKQWDNPLTWHVCRRPNFLHRLGRMWIFC